MPHPERLAPSHPITQLHRGRRVTCLRTCNQIDATRAGTTVGSTLFPVCRISCDMDADKLLYPEPVAVCEATIPMVRVTSRIERVLPLHTRRSSYVLGFSGPRLVVGPAIYLCSKCQEPPQSTGGGFCFRQRRRLAKVMDGWSPGTAASAAANASSASSQRLSL